MAAGVFREYQTNIHPPLAKNLVELVDRLLPDPIAKVDTQAMVELTALRKGDDLIVHLVNHSAREDLSGYWYPVYTYMPELRDVECLIRTDKRQSEIFHAPSGEKAKAVEEGCWSRVIIPSLEYMATLHVPACFQD